MTWTLEERVRRWRWRDENSPCASLLETAWCMNHKIKVLCSAVLNWFSPLEAMVHYNWIHLEVFSLKVPVRKQTLIHLLNLILLKRHATSETRWLPLLVEPGVTKWQVDFQFELDSLSWMCFSGELSLRSLELPMEKGGGEKHEWQLRYNQPIRRWSTSVPAEEYLL